MRAFRPVWTQNATGVLYARDFSHVPCLCRDRQMPVDTSRIQPTIDRVGARTSPEFETKTSAPSQAPSWKSTGKDRPNQLDLEVKTGCFHLEIFGAQPLQISSLFRARIILGSFWARVHGRCGVPVVLHGPKSCWLENYCDHNVHVICKNVTENIPSIPLREPSCT